MNGRIFTIVLVLGVTLVLIQAVNAQTGTEPVALTIRLRAADGRPVTGEPVTLQRLPDEEPVLPACTTDAHGTCTWQVGRGLYQVLFDRPLDDVSALALAEGGLRGFGLTVGEAPITYNFTLHSDGHVYFDAAPEAAWPAPVIATLELLHGGIAPTISPEATVAPDPAETEPDGNQAVGGAANPSAVGKEESTGRQWRLLVFIALGLTAGGGLHRWSRRKNRAAPRGKAAPTAIEEDADA